MLELFIDKKFRADTVEIIDKANEIIREYQALGFTLTLRQLYYQFVSRDLIRNRQSEYKRLGSIINDARLAGLIDWEAIEDRTRNLRGGDGWADDPEDFIKNVAPGYREALWSTQRNHVEVWIEKDALIGVIEPVCNRWRLGYFACRGYTSQSEQWRAGHRFRRLHRAGKRVVVLHLGDHDPSGIDMTRDNTDRLAMFTTAGVDVRRLALNWDQVEEYSPPPNPAKETDSRAEAYMREYGESSWELDALDPTVIDGIIQAELDKLIDLGRWENAVAAEEANRDRLQRVADRWDDVLTFLGED